VGVGPWLNDRGDPLVCPIHNAREMKEKGAETSLGSQGWLLGGGQLKNSSLTAHNSPCCQKTRDGPFEVSSCPTKSAQRGVEGSKAKFQSMTAPIRTPPNLKEENYAATGSQLSPRRRREKKGPHRKILPGGAGSLAS